MNDIPIAEQGGILQQLFGPEQADTTQSLGVIPQNESQVQNARYKL